MTDKDKFLIFMSLAEISNKKQETLLEKLDSFSIENVLQSPITADTLTTDELHKLMLEFNKKTLEKLLENMEKRGIEVLTIFSESYPQSLIDLPDRPLILFAKGDLSLLDGTCLAVVGTRTPTNYGKIMTEKFTKELARSGFVIVSGLCHGIDTIAHKATLEVGGKTIAVLGGGFDHIYPSINVNLAGEIAKTGLVLSEYPPPSTPKKYTFPRRNRIVAGLSKGVFIPEAGMKSGTIHTKDFALEYGKDIFALPGNVSSEKSNLPNMLIQTAQAYCVLEAEDIAKQYDMNIAKQKRVEKLSFDESAILSALKNEECTFEVLAEKTKIPVNILSSCLTMMEIRGLIKKLPAQTYAKI